jgi:processive 1,2-diacylglycerol beta-glucosyltransferase
MIRIYDAEADSLLGEITELQFQFLHDMLEEESTTDRDYFISQATLELFEQTGAHPDFLAMLRKAIGDREGIEIRWE